MISIVWLKNHLYFIYYDDECVCLGAASLCLYLLVVCLVSAHCLLFLPCLT